MIEPQLLTHNEWTFRWQPARKTPPRLLVLVHGLTGDENSMWMLVRNLSPQYAILAPRGLFPANEGGYTWRKKGNVEQNGFPSDSDLIPAAEELIHFIGEWRQSSGIEASQVDLIGFSQGAAMVYLLTLLFPDRIRKLAALSGFLPEGEATSSKERGLAGKEIFVAHGRRDEMVPVDRARRDVALLKEMGARVTYCESDAGHKVSRECLLAVETFFKEGA